MKKAERLLIIISIVSLALSCVERASIDLEDTIVIELDLDKTETTYLDSIVHNVRFVPLETTSECLIENYFDIRLAGEKIFIHSRSSVQDAIFVFDLDGNYLFKIDYLGRGPSEYIAIMGFHVNQESEEIFISAPDKIMIYDSNGRYLQSHSSGLYPLGDLVFFSGRYFMRTFLLDDLESSSNTINFVGIYDEDWNLLSHTLPVRKRYYYSTHFRRRQSLIPHKDNLFYIDPESPVIYSYGKEGFRPKYKIDYGAHSVSKKHEDKLYELDGPSFAAWEYAKANNLAFPGSERFYFSENYYYIETRIADGSHNFFYNPVNEKTVRVESKRTYHTAMYPGQIRCYENQFFGIREAHSIRRSIDIIAEIEEGKQPLLTLDQSGPFSHTGFSNFDSIKHDDNAVIVFFDIKDGFLK